MDVGRSQDRRSAALRKSSCDLAMTAPQPVIGIVVPAFNAARFLEHTLTSISMQTETRWQCVIVDDGSADNSARIAARFVDSDARFRLVTQRNRGASAARNTGFRAVTAPYITFMDSDDVWLPHALETLVARLQCSDSAAGSHGLAEFIDAEGRLVAPGAHAATGRKRLGREGRRLVPRAPDQPTDFDVLINGNVLFPPGLVLARRSAYEEVGPFDESLTGAEDWDMLIRLSRQGHLEFIDEVLLHYRRHDSNFGAAVTIPQQAWFVRCKAFHSPENTPEQRRAAKLGWRAYQVHLAGHTWRSVGSALRRGRVGAAMKDVFRLGAFFLRYVRGWPHPRVKSTPLRW